MFFVLLLLALGVEEVVPAAEVFLHDDTDALGVERGAGEVSVVGLVVDLEGEVAVREEEVTDVEVANEGGAGCGGVVTIAELAVDEQSVVKQSAVDDAFVLGIVPAFVACGYVGTEVPVVALDDL